MGDIQYRGQGVKIVVVVASNAKLALLFLNVPYLLVFFTGRLHFVRRLSSHLLFFLITFPSAPLFPLSSPDLFPAASNSCHCFTFNMSITTSTTATSDGVKPEMAATSLTASSIDLLTCTPEVLSAWLLEHRFQVSYVEKINK